MSKDMFEKKYKFIKNLEMVLFLDKENNALSGIDYYYNEDANEEVIEITFIGGGSMRMLATGQSNGANARAIINNIYPGAMYE